MSIRIRIFVVLDAKNVYIVFSSYVLRECHTLIILNPLPDEIACQEWFTYVHL